MIAVMLIFTHRELRVCVSRYTPDAKKHVHTTHTHIKWFLIKMSSRRHWASHRKWPKVSPEGRSVNSGQLL